jgi:outer membrane protein, multidrug efflux system
MSSTSRSVRLGLRCLGCPERSGTTPLLPGGWSSVLRSRPCGLDPAPRIRRRSLASSALGSGRLLLALLGLSACSATVRAPLLDGATPTEWRLAPQGDLPATDLDTWWTVFSDPELDALVDRALAANLTIRESVSRLRAARSLASRVAPGFRPTLDIHTDSDTNPGTKSGYFEVSFDSVWELGWFGRADSAERIAGAEVEATDSDVRAARVSVVAEVARNYVAMRAASARARWLGDALERVREALRFVQLRRDRGLASDADVARATARVAEAEARLPEPQQIVVESQQRLALLLGEAEPDPAIVAEGDQPVLEGARITAAPADLLRKRPEIRRAEAAVLRAAGALGIATSDLYPRVALAGSITLAVGETGPDAGMSQVIPTVGPLVDIPLFDWGVRRAVVGAKDAELEASELAYRRAVLEGVAEVEVALSALDRSYAHCLASRSAAASYERALSATEARLRHGLADGLERSNAAEDLDVARAAAAAAESDHAIAFVALCKALGGAAVQEAKP